MNKLFSPFARPVAASLDWGAIGAELDARGAARTDRLLEPEACALLRRRYADPSGFRSRVVMSRHGFGSGEYQYFADPLPDIVSSLRDALFPPLSAIANRWAERLGADARYPEALPDFTAQCHAAGQMKPTPLLLKYGPGDYNCLHQDLYGPLVFPLQVVILLSEPGRDFEGGEFMLVEQRPRMQSRGEVVALRQGEAAIFPVHHRPVKGARGDYRATMRHGVSRIRSGERFALGIIFHDAA